MHYALIYHASVITTMTTSYSTWLLVFENSNITYTSITKP